MATPYTPSSFAATQPSASPQGAFDMTGFDQQLAELQQMLTDLDGDGIPDSPQGDPSLGAPPRISPDARYEQDYSDQFRSVPPPARRPPAAGPAGPVGLDMKGLGEEARQRISAGEPRESVIQDLFMRVTRQRAAESGQPQRMAEARGPTMNDAGPDLPQDFGGLPGTEVDMEPENFGYVGEPPPPPLSGPEMRNRLLGGMPPMEQAREAPLSDEVPARSVRTNDAGEVMQFPDGEPIPDLSDAPAFGRQGIEGGLGQVARDYAPEVAASAMGPIGRGFMTAARSAPALTTMTLAALGASAGADEAGTNSEAPMQRLHTQRAALEARRERFAQDMERQKGRNKRGERPLYDEAKRSYDAMSNEISGVDAMIAEAQRQAAEEQRRSSPEFQQDVEKRARDLEREEKEREASTPFRERYPEIAGNLPAIGLGLAAGLPFSLGARNAMGTFARNSHPSRVNDAIRRADEAIATGSPTSALNRMELDRLVAAQPTTRNRLLDAAAAAGAGGALAAEANLFPDQYDAFNLPPGEDRDAAMERIMDPTEYLKRGAVGAITGLSGYEASRLMPRREANIPRAEATRDFMQSQERAATKRNRLLRDERERTALPPPEAPAPAAPEPRVFKKDAQGNYHDEAGRFVAPPPKKPRK